MSIQNINSMEIDLPCSFGLRHTNIASLNLHIMTLHLFYHGLILNLHINDLTLILSWLNFKFDIIFVKIHHHLVIFRYLATWNLFLKPLKLLMGGGGGGVQAFTYRIILILSLGRIRK